MVKKHRRIAIFVPHLGCPQQCSFCNQHHIAGAAHAPAPGDVRSICDAAFALDGGRALAGCDVEIAFFGGSFTALPRSYYESLLAAAQPYIAAGQVRGIRLSTRPDAVDADTLEILGSYGVTAVELGAQSMDDRVLALAQRGHTAEDVRAAGALIKAAGLELALQMMLGLPGDSAAGAMATARELAAIGPHGVRIYPTVVLEGTQLAQEYKAGRYNPLPLGEGIELAAQLLEYFEQRGIAVIRLGLHASPGMEAQMLAGCYHPALRELCESELYYKKLTRHLAATGHGGGELHVRCAPGELSKVLGHGRANAQRLAAQNIILNVLQCDGITRGSLEFD